jgi:hypothetical protein
MFCKVAECNTPSTHVTFGHKCFICGLYGHGHKECGINFKVKHLRQYSYDKMPNNMICTVMGCYSSHTHSIDGHHHDNNVVANYYDYNLIDRHNVWHDSEEADDEAEDDEIEEIHYDNDDGQLNNLGGYGSDIINNDDEFNRFMASTFNMDNNHNDDNDERINIDNLDTIRVKCPFCRVINVLSNDRTKHRINVNAQCTICETNYIDTCLPECRDTVCWDCVQQMIEY